MSECVVPESDNQASLKLFSYGLMLVLAKRFGVGVNVFGTELYQQGGKRKGGQCDRFVKNTMVIFFYLQRNFKRQTRGIGSSKKSQWNLPCHRRDKPG